MGEMDILFKGSVAKYSEHPDDNEDVFRVAAERGRIVISDGASESYDGKGWAELLVNKFSDSELSSAGLDECLDDFWGMHDPANLVWSKVAAWERGSFATLLIAQQYPDGVLQLSCIGDSCAVLTDGDSILKLVPYTRSSDFQEKPTLLSSKEAYNQSLIVGGQLEARVSWDGSSKSPLYLLCMTDAMGAWLLQSIEGGGTTALKRLLAIRTETELAELVEGERQAGTMRRDDSTLVVVWLETGCDT